MKKGLAESTAMAMCTWLADRFGVIVALHGAGDTWTIDYMYPEPYKEFPTITVTGDGISVPAGSPQIIVDMLMGMKSHSVH